MKTISKLWQRFGELIDNFLSRVGLLLVAKATHIVLLLVALAVVVMVSESIASCLQELLGVDEKYDVLKTIGFCVAGVLLVWQAGAANKRAKAMEDTAREQAKATENQAKATENQAKATENTEEEQRQERLKNAIEHLGHGSDSVRMGGAYELFHLAKDTEKLRQTVLDILCAHIRQTTGGNDYQEKHKTKPSEEIQSLLTLLFMDEHNVFGDCSINLQGSYLNGATLSQARLKRANLREAQLQEANLEQAQLEIADLREAQLQEANLREARLERADLTEARLKKAKFWKAQLQGAKLWRAQLQKADLMATQLQGAALSVAQLQEADLSNAQLQEVSLSYAKMQGADLIATQLQGAGLIGAEMQGANLSKAQLQGANLFEVQLQGANLSKAQLQGANLGLAQLQEANLRATKLQGVSSLEVHPAGFENRIENRIGKDSDLAGITFSGGLQEEDLDTLCEGLSDDQAQALREKLVPHVRPEVSHELPRGAETGAYTKEEAEQWIAEYRKAMREVPKRDDG